MAYISKITPLGSTTTYDLSALKVRSFSTIGSSSTDHATALKNFFDNNKANTPRNELIHFYDGSQGNGSASFGYFLSGYDTAPYGGFFVAHYNNPYYVGIQSGSYVQQHLLTSTNYTSYTVTKTGSGASGTWGISITGNAATATKATNDSDGNTINTTYLKKSGGNITGNLNIEYNKQIVFYGKNNNTSPRAIMGYTNSMGGIMHCENAANHQTSGAFYISSNGCDTANDNGGIAIDNEGVTVFGAGDPGNNFTGVFRVINEDSVGTGPIFTVKKAGACYFGNGQTYYISNDGSQYTGNAATATALTTNAGSSTQPVYFSGGKPVAATAYSGLLTGVSWNAGTTAGPELSITVGGTTKKAVIPSASTSASGIVTTGEQTFTGTKIFNDTIIGNANKNYPFHLNANSFFVNKALDWNSASYYEWVYLLLPVLTSTNQSAMNFIEGTFNFWKTGGNVYDNVKINLNCCYNSLEYYLDSYGQGTDWKLVTCTYNGIKYYALKGYYHANPYTHVTFSGHVNSQLPGGNNTSTKPLNLPYAVAYYNYTSNSANAVILNSEINSSLSDTLTDANVTSVVRRGLSNAGGFIGNASSSSAVKDYNNGTLTKFGYSTSGMTTASWIGAWDPSVSGEYRLRAITPANVVKAGTTGGTKAQFYRGDNTWSNTLEGTLNLKPSSGSWVEGIRIHSASTGWATIVLCGTDNTGDSGTSANSWSLHSYNGDFYLANNGSNTAATKITGHKANGFSIHPRLAINADSNSSYNLYVNGNGNFINNLTVGKTIIDSNIAINNTAFVNSISIFHNESAESSGETFTETKPSWGIGFQRQWSTGNTTGAAAGIYAVGVSGWRTGLAFRVKNNGTAAGGTHDITSMWLAPGGNVGIGSLSPSQKLHISGGNLAITNNSNTVTIGSQNTSYTHVYNSANIPFILNNSLLTTTGTLGNTSYPFNNLYIGKAGAKGIYYVGTKTTNQMITFLDNTSDTYGNGIKIGGGGAVVIGGGESAANLSVTAGTENTYILADGQTYVEAGGDTIANRIGFQVTNAGHVLPVKAEANNTKAQDLGSTAAMWRNIYLGNNGEVGVEVDNTQTTNPNKVAFIVGSSGNGGIYSRKHSKWIVYSDASGNVVLNGNANTASKLANARTISLTGSVTGSASFDGSGNISIATTTNHTHSDYIPKSIGTTKGDIIYWSAGSTPARLGIGSNGKVLKVVSGVPAWGDVSIPYGETLPSTGTNGDVFLQTSAEYYELPTGGTTGQLLAKSSNTDRAVHWVDAPPSTVSPSSVKFYPAGSTVATTNSNPQIFNTAIYVENNVLFGAAWNDYAEFRKDNPIEKQEPGRCVRELGDGTLALTTQRLERGCEIISNTFGFAIGQDEKNGYNTPIASSGRVLAYPYESIEEFSKHIGWPVCSGPNGTVSIMTEEEEEKYPSRIIGTISEIPTYKEWGASKVPVNGRIWIRIK